MDEDVFIQIMDNGIGIPEAHIPYIFNPFFRVHNDSEGSGLGLSIVKTMVEAHGGKIWAESIPGNGSAFNITLPKHKRVYIQKPGGKKKRGFYGRHKICQK